MAATPSSSDTANPAAANPAAPKLCVEHLNMHFDRDGKQLAVLEDINLDIFAGEFICILGPSGCGKSTLLSAIGGFLKPSSGRISIDGETVTRPDPRRIFVFQERGVFPWLTVEGNIAFGLFKLTAKERAQRIAHYVNLVGLGGFEHSFPHELSGGMKQRLEVARALAVSPDTLYMDEPFGALDSITRFTMRSELLRLWQAERNTIVFVTHDVDETVQLAGRIVMMSARPATIQQVIRVDLPYPRDPASPAYHEVQRTVLQAIGMVTA